MARILAWRISNAVTFCNERHERKSFIGLALLLACGLHTCILTMSTTAKLRPTFGRIAIDKGYVRPQALTEVLQQQKRMADRDVLARLGELMLLVGQLNVEQLFDVLGEQVKTVRVCRHCERTFRVAVPSGNKKRPRCPECGEPFDEKWLKAGYAPPAVTSRPMRVYATIALIVLICLIFPHAWLEFDMRVLTPRQGRAQAQRDWGNGEPKWYILPNDPLYSIRFPLRSHHDPTTGLILEPDIPFGRRSSPRWNRNIHAWKLAYRAVIAAKLRRTPALPITAHLLDYDEMDTILNSGMTTPGSV